MGIIRRTFEHLNKTTFLLLYKALVRPHLEYANQVWAPILKKHETMIENVQRRATKQIPGFSDLSYEQRLKDLNLPTLKYRRTRGDMIELYKIVSNKYDEKVCNFIPLCVNRQHDTRGHKYKLEKRFARLNVRKNAFINRCVDMWNALPDTVVDAKTTRSFEARLDRFWKNEEFKFDACAPLPTVCRKTELTAEAARPEESEEDL